MERNGTLTPIQIRAIKALLESRNITIACKRLHVGRTTIYRWLEEPIFRDALQKAESEAIEGVSRALLAGSEIAVITLEKMMLGAEFDSVKVRSAVSWLELLMRYRDYSVLSKRLEEIENGLAELYEKIESS